MASSGPRSCLGLLSPRTATLLLALVGIVAHLHAYAWLGALHASFPSVPQRLPYTGSTPPLLAHIRLQGSPLPSSSPSTASAESGVAAVADAAAAEAVPQAVADAQAYLYAQVVEPDPTRSSAVQIAGDRPGAAAAAAAAAWTGMDSWTEVAPWRLFNVLPSPPTRGGIAGDEDGEGEEDMADEERMSWDAMRLLTSTLRGYILISVLCCVAGVLGVLKSHLLLARLFVLHSFLDLFLSTLSLLSLALLCTYPAVRSQICEELAAGELGRLGTSSPLERSGSSPRAAAHNGGGPLDAEQAAQGVGEGFQMLVDSLFGAENCEESFGQTVVPVLMIFGLLYTAIRLHFFLTIHSYYTSLLRSRVAFYYGPTSASYVSATSALTGPLSPGSNGNLSDAESYKRGMAKKHEDGYERRSGSGAARSGRNAHAQSQWSSGRGNEKEKEKELPAYKA